MDVLFFRKNHVGPPYPQMNRGGIRRPFYEAYLPPPKRPGSPCSHDVSFIIAISTLKKEVIGVFRKQIQDHGAIRLALICTCLPLLFSACQNTSGSPVKNDPPQTLTLRIAAQQSSIGSTSFQIVAQISTPTVGTTPTQQTSSLSNPINTSRPVLAFYYPWYTSATWCSCHMSDYPTILYNSSDNTTIARQVTDFGRGLGDAGTFENATRYHFASSIYFESDSPRLSGTSTIIAALRYVLAHYSNDAHFFHWRGKPVIFFWDPLGNGRTLATWAYIRSQVDPNNQTIWSGCLDQPGCEY